MILGAPMKRPTVTDLANAAGLSVSTVNRLLHGTGALRPDTVERILNAAQSIGFYGLGILRERKQTNLPRRRLGFLLQQSHRAINRLWADSIVAAASRRVDTLIEPVIEFEDDLSPEAVAGHLLALGEACDAVAVVTADHPLISQAIDELRARDTPVIAYITDLSAASRAAFVGTDNWKAGRTAAWFISQMARRPGKVFPFVGSHRYQCQDISDASFRSYMRERAPAFVVHETQLTNEEPQIAYEIVRRLIAEEPDLVGIFVAGGGISGVLRAMRAFDAPRRQDIKIVCRDIGPEAQKGLAEGLITAAVPHSLKRMPEELIEVMLDRIEGRGQTSIQQRIVPFDIVTPESA